MPGRTRKGNWSTSKINKNREPEVATPSDSDSVGDEVVDRDDSDIDQSSSDAEHADGLRTVAERSAREEADSLYHISTHKPIDPQTK